MTDPSGNTGSHFVWSITSRNLNQFQKNLVFWNQHEKFYLLMKFEENDPFDKLLGTVMDLYGFVAANKFGKKCWPYFVLLSYPLALY